MSCLSFAITGAYGGIGTCGEIYNRDGCGDSWEDRGMLAQFVLFTYVLYLSTIGLVLRVGGEWNEVRVAEVRFCIFPIVQSAWIFLLCRLCYWCATLISHFDGIPPPPGIYDICVAPL